MGSCESSFIVVTNASLGSRNSKASQNDSSLQHYNNNLSTLCACVCVWGGGSGRHDDGGSIEKGRKGWVAKSQLF